MVVIIPEPMCFYIETSVIVKLEVGLDKRSVGRLLKPVLMRLPPTYIYSGLHW